MEGRTTWSEWRASYWPPLRQVKRTRGQGEERKRQPMQNGTLLAAVLHCLSLPVKNADDGRPITYLNV